MGIWPAATGTWWTTEPRWIAYRMIFSSGTTVHLDVSACGDYDTGLRIVGSLKSQPALNVLAAYEK